MKTKEQKQKEALERQEKYKNLPLEKKFQKAGKKEAAKLAMKG